MCTLLPAKGRNQLCKSCRKAIVQTPVSLSGSGLIRMKGIADCLYQLDPAEFLFVALGNKWGR